MHIPEGTLQKMNGAIEKSSYTLSASNRAFDMAEGDGVFRPGHIDSYGKRRQPSDGDLMAEVKNTTASCIEIRAVTCAMQIPRLYVKTTPGLFAAKSWDTGLETRPVDPRLEKSMKDKGIIEPQDTIEEVPSHPLLDVLVRPNPKHDQFDLYEFMSRSEDIFGIWYLYLGLNPMGFGVDYILPLPKFWVEPRYESTQPQMDLLSMLLPTYYRVCMYVGNRFQMMDVPQHQIAFGAIPDDRNPYMGGRSPLREHFELACLNSENIAHQLALEQNRARPDGIISPGDHISEDEREAFEKRINQKFRQGGLGRLMVAPEGTNFIPLNFGSNEGEILAKHATTKEDIANGYGVPMSYITKETNLANLQGSETLFMSKTIWPKVYRRDQRLTRILCPLYDPSGALFLSSDNPVPEDEAAKREQEKSDLEHAVTWINEVRKERKLPPVEWGEFPWIPQQFFQVDPADPNAHLEKLGENPKENERKNGRPKEKIGKE